MSRQRSVDYSKVTDSIGKIVNSSRRDACKARARQGGFAVSYLVLGIAAIGALAALVWAWRAYTDSIDQAGYRRGAAETAAKWEARENEQIRSAEDLRRQLEADRRAAEAGWARELAAVSAGHQAAIVARDRRHAADLDAVRRGSLVLRDPGSTGAAACQGSGGDRGGAIATGAGRRDGAPGGQLSDEAAGFLLVLAREADAVVEQLGACQAVISADRR